MTVGWLDGLVIAVHLAATLALAAYGLHRLWLAGAYLTRVRSRGRPAPDAPARLPKITVQIPLYNERHVAERAIDAAARLDYPRKLLEIQVLDDSTDETQAIVSRAVGRLRALGFAATHLRRTDRSGFKAGALAAGLSQASGELIAIFDADFVPRPDFLRRVVGEFRDPAVGMVQARWGHLNQSGSLLTRLQALQLDAHFTIEHGVREATGCFFNFNGTAGVWRRTAIESAGGWRALTLTEDLDLSYRAQLAGWRFVYRDDVEAPAELPVEVTAYRQQQQRWAQGGVQTARLILPTLLRAKVPGRVKREALWHLTGHIAYPVLIVLALAGLAVGSVVSAPDLRGLVLVADFSILGFAALALGAFYGVAAYGRGGRGWWRRVALVPGIMVLGAGISVGQTAAVLRGLLGRATPFRRTPKYRLESVRDTSWQSSAYRVLASGPAVLECVIGLLVLATAALASGGAPAPTGMALLCGVGFLTVGGGTLVQRPRGAAWTHASRSKEPGRVRSLSAWRPCNSSSTD